MHQNPTRPEVLPQDTIPITHSPAELLPQSLSERTTIEIQRARSVLAEVREVLETQIARLDSVEASLSLLVEAPPPGRAIFLTTDEREVLRLIAENYTNYAIGQRLRRSDRTATTVLAHIYAKLGATNRTTVILKAWQLGLI
ncbi:MAG TPA: LuxR C-terminal-related transcriptional regulator [Herpetosiphonaceae bacterium]